MTEPVARAGADLRVLRAAVFTAACVALSAGGHVLAAGAAVPWWTLGAAVALVFAVAVPLAGRERSLPGIAGLLAAGQMALHTLFASAGTGSPDVRPSGGRSDLLALAGSLVCNDRAAAALTEAEARRLVADAGLSGAVPHSGHSHADAAMGGYPGGGNAAAECLAAVMRTALAMASGPMLLGHLLAALGAGWLLRRGESALWRLVRLSAVAADELLLLSLRTALTWACARRGEGSGHALPAWRGSGDPDGVRPPRTGALRHSLSRRGPPAARDSYALTA